MGAVKRTLLTVGLATLLSTALAACSPEVGSEAWCEEMNEKDKGEWSANEARDFAKSCIL